MKTGFVKVIVCMILAGSLAVPIQALVTTTPRSLSTTLYVGGSGPGNYTSIQAAINASADGDTIYVYNDSSPYIESVIVNKNIALIGEDAATTIIDNMEDNATDYTVRMAANGSSIQGFSIMYAVTANLLVKASHVTVADIILPYSSMIGLYVNDGNMTIEGTTIRDCVIEGETSALGIFDANDTRIIDNTLTSTFSSILMAQSFNTNISYNTITAEQGIFVLYCTNTIITQNTLTKCKDGIDLVCSTFMNITRNNFLNTSRIAESSMMPFLSILSKLQQRKDNPFFFDHYRVIGRSIWDANYYNRPHKLPVIIPGQMTLFGPKFLHHNWINIDWHPAQTPNDI
jgi:parallel beta-helix repeat protein